MENKNVVHEQAKKDEVIEIKLEPVNFYSESLGVHEIAWKPIIEDNNHGNIEEIVSNRIKKEHNDATEWIQCDVKNEKVVEMQLEEIKFEQELDTVKLEVTEITEELIFKNETNSDMFKDENVEVDYNRISSEHVEAKEGATFTPTAVENMDKIEEIDLEMFIGMKLCQDIDAAQFRHDHSIANTKPNVLVESAVERKIPRKQRHVICKGGSKKSFSCYNCNYTVYHKHHLISHMKEHKDPYLHSSSGKPGRCMHCKMTFRSEKILDEHTIKKHPKFITSVSHKIHECTHCTFKTIFKTKLSTHIFTHSNNTAGRYLNTCSDCSAAFTSSCTHCKFETIHKNDLTRHVLKHSETARRYKLSTCIHCNATFKSKINLDDHTVKKHPDFIASISRKIHACSHCTYKTVIKNDLAMHTLSHPDVVGSYKLSTCLHCNATFTKKQGLDDHTLRKHPDLIASVSRKIHECTHCIYKTIYKNDLTKHMLKHPEITDTCKLNTCIHCNATFKSKKALDDHTLKKHPDFIASVSTKIHKCPHCMYATTSKTNLARHVMLQHTETAGSYQLSTCIHCNATFTRNENLDNHIVRIHPDFIASVSRKVYKCLHCTHATVWKSDLARHMKKHFKSARSYKLITCTHCNATLKKKQSLDYHILRKHPDLIASVSREIHECTHCIYKTIYKNDLTKHMLKHPEIADTWKLNTCIHCNATFKKKQSLDDHTLRKHPDLIASVSRKIHECTHCTYKTIYKNDFTKHMLKHPEITDTCKLKTCIHCNATFKSKKALDDHTLKKHPDFIASVSTKIHECRYCTYKTTIKSNFTEHMFKHPETAGSHKFNPCMHCSAVFKSKQDLEDHAVRIHPECIASVSG